MENPLIEGQDAAMHPREKGEGFPGQRIVVLPRPVVAKARDHPLLAALLPTDIGYFPKATGHYRQRQRGVDQAIFIYCTRGGGWCELSGRQHSIRPGELLVIPPGLPHTYGTDPARPWTIHWFHVAGGEVGARMAELGVSRERPVLSPGVEPRLLGLFEELLSELELGYAPVHLVYAARVLSHLLGLMVRHRDRNRQGEPDAAHHVAASVAFMKEHLDRPLRVRTLASLANLSPSHFTALFRQQTGYAPIDYFIRLRMHHACQLLDTSQLSVKAVAGTLGYDDPLYFSRLFKTVNEVSPQQYRDQRKG